MLIQQTVTVTPDTAPHRSGRATWDTATAGSRLVAATPQLPADAGLDDSWAVHVRARLDGTVVTVEARHAVHLRALPVLVTVDVP